MKKEDVINFPQKQTLKTWYVINRSKITVTSKRINMNDFYFDRVLLINTYLSERPSNDKTNFANIISKQGMKTSRLR